MISCTSPSDLSNLAYHPGFGSHVCTEALPGALPAGRNSPQRVAYGLYTEQISGTAFTTPRADNRRTWVYRQHPSAGHEPCRLQDARALKTAPFNDAPPVPTPLRWDPLPQPAEPTDFIDGLATFGGNGDASAQWGIGIHRYVLNRPMSNKAMANADGEMLLVPQAGRLLILTELGRLEVGPCEIAVIPRGIRFSVSPLDGTASGYVCENYGTAFRLPELGPIGSNGLANVRDFLYPTAWFEQSDAPYQIVTKFQGSLWSHQQAWSPFDVVAWHGNLAPYKYDCRNFMTIGTVSFDHPDPSIYTVLTSPSHEPGVANADFVVFPSRWLVAEDSFRPPWFHRNIMSEFMGLIHGVYEAKKEGFVPGGCSLHNSMVAHGPDKATYERAISETLAPQKMPDTLAFMFETRYVIRPTLSTMQDPGLQPDYWKCWSGFDIHFNEQP